MKSSLGFEIISQDTARERFTTKTTGVRTVKCPRCGHIFNQGGNGGCFIMLWTPLNCPNDCGFPWPEKRVHGSTRITVSTKPPQKEAIR